MALAVCALCRSSHCDSPTSLLIQSAQVIRDSVGPGGELKNTCGAETRTMVKISLSGQDRECEIHQIVLGTCNPALHVFQEGDTEANQCQCGAN